jgi:hypothetical protein
MVSDHPAYYKQYIDLKLFATFVSNFQVISKVELIN